MSAFGSKQTRAAALHMSAFGGRADIDCVRQCYGWQDFPLIGHDAILIAGPKRDEQA